MTFADCAKAYVEAHRPSWRGVRHAEAWAASLANHAAIARVPCPWPRSISAMS